MPLPSPSLDRRRLLAGSAAALTSVALPWVGAARAQTAGQPAAGQPAAGLAASPPAAATAPAPEPPAPTPPVPVPPLTSREAFVEFMVKARGEKPDYLARRWARYLVMVANRDVSDERNKRAFLLTPREEFCRPQNLSRAYDSAFLDIGYGVTISGPHLVGRMTTAINVQPGDKVLEIGTGSGYQSAYLSHLTDKVWSIEIIKPLAERTRGVYDGLIGRGYTEFRGITSKNSDGYYGWPEAGPFDKIIVTCGIDHIPPPLLQQLKTGGVMVIPVGPPGAQHVLKVTKTQSPDGTFQVARSDIYNGRIVPFVPFTKLEGDAIQGTHNG